MPWKKGEKWRRKNILWKDLGVIMIKRMLALVFLTESVISWLGPLVISQEHSVPAGVNPGASGGRRGWPYGSASKELLHVYGTGTNQTTCHWSNDVFWILLMSSLQNIRKFNDTNWEIRFWELIKSINLLFYIYFCFWHFQVHKKIEKL